MSVENTIASLLQESRKLQESENVVTKSAVAADSMPKLDVMGSPAASGAHDEPSNKKNFVDDEEEAKGGTSKKPNRATQGATAPEGQHKLETVESEVVSDEAPIVEYDMSEDVNALFNGEEGLTEAFRQKAETIFEAAVTSRIKEEIARVTESLETKHQAMLAEAIEEKIEGLVEHVDGYLNLMVEQWMENNAVALESGMKSDILESFVGGLKNLFEEHYIDVPEEKFDIVGDMTAEIESLNAKLDEAVAVNVELNTALNETVRADIIVASCDGLSDIEAEKLQTLAEEISFEDSESFTAKMQTIRENYFSKKSAKIDSPSFLTEETSITETVVPVDMQKYVSAISSLTR